MAKKTISNSGTGIKINTTNVRNVADKLTSLNNGIENDFDNICLAINNLDLSWDGSASNNAISKFNKFKSESKGGSGRKAIMLQHIKFLYSNVSNDYEKAENTNNNLSSLFK